MSQGVGVGWGWGSERDIYMDRNFHSTKTFPKSAGSLWIQYQNLGKYNYIQTEN